MSLLVAIDPSLLFSHISPRIAASQSGFAAENPGTPTLLEMALERLTKARDQAAFVASVEGVVAALRVASVPAQTRALVVEMVLTAGGSNISWRGSRGANSPSAARSVRPGSHRGVPPLSCTETETEALGSARPTG